MNQHIFRVTSSSNTDEQFFYYLLEYLKPHFVGIARNKQTTGLGHVTKKDLKTLIVGIPTIQEQVAIGDLLGALDNKIELNRRMNRTLDEILRTLFKSYFIDFDPVRAKMENHWLFGQSILGLSVDCNDLFPDQFVDSELGAIPKGWSIKPLDEIASFRNGLALQRFKPEDDEENPLSVVKIAQLKSGRPDSGEWASANINPECILADGDIIFSWSGSLVVVIWTGGPAALNQHLFKVTANHFPKWFVYHWLLEHLSQFRAIASDKATTMGHIRPHHLSEARCVAPDYRTLQMIDGAFAPLFDNIIQRTLESRVLENIRDNLVPYLLGGRSTISGNSIGR